MFERKAQGASLPPVTFPEGFSWGVSTASYQIEGAVCEGGRGPSIWDNFSAVPGNVLHGDTGEIACDHYHRLEEDLDLIAGLGVDVYRFSIAWPRIQPTGRGAANQTGLDFYSSLIDGLLERGIQPVPTLYHWDLPQALVDDGLDWRSREAVTLFGDYAQILFDAFGDRVSLWTTFNEPWASAYLGYYLGVHAPGIADEAAAAAAHHHLLLAHGEAVRRFRAMDGKGRIGIALNLMHHYPASQDPADIAATAQADAQLNTSFLNPVLGKGYPDNLGSLGAHWQEGEGLVLEGDLAAIAAPVDFISVNSYHPRWICAADRLTEARIAGYEGKEGGPLSFGMPYVDVIPATVPRTGMSWPVHAEGFTDLLDRLAADCCDVPLYISENGFAGSDYLDQRGEAKDPERIEYLNNHLRAVRTAIDRGADIRGYWQWSFMDNFEWGFGYSIRFGLVYVDYPTGRRVPKSSYAWYRNVVATNGIGVASQQSQEQELDQANV